MSAALAVRVDWLAATLFRACFRLEKAAKSVIVLGGWRGVFLPESQTLEFLSQELRDRQPA